MTTGQFFFRYSPFHRIRFSCNVEGGWEGLIFGSGISSPPDSGSVATSSAAADSTCLYALGHNGSLLQDTRPDAFVSYRHVVYRCCEYIRSNRWGTGCQRLADRANSFQLLQVSRFLRSFTTTVIHFPIRPLPHTVYTIKVTLPYTYPHLTRDTFHLTTIFLHRLNFSPY